MGIKSVFIARLVDHTGDGTMTDGGVLWEVVGADGGRIASCSTEEAAKALQVALNRTVADWVAGDTADRLAEA